MVRGTVAAISLIIKSINIYNYNFINYIIYIAIFILLSERPTNPFIHDPDKTPTQKSYDSGSNQDVPKLEWTWKKAMELIYGEEDDSEEDNSEEDKSEKDNSEEDKSKGGSEGGNNGDSGKSNGDSGENKGD
jgi:hypothetical protein